MPKFGFAESEELIKKTNLEPRITKTVVDNFHLRFFSREGSFLFSDSDSSMSSDNVNPIFEEE